MADRIISTWTQSPLDEVLARPWHGPEKATLCRRCNEPMVAHYMHIKGHDPVAAAGSHSFKPLPVSPLG
jgi:hypothetical protein